LKSICLKFQIDVVMFFCRSWPLSQWRCWRWCWCGRTSCCIQVTLRLMMTAVHAWLASRGVLSVEHFLCCRQCASTGIALYLAGLIHQLHTGWDIGSGSS